MVPIRFCNKSGDNMLRTGSSPQIFGLREHVSDYTYFIGDRLIGAQIIDHPILSA
jgi:hypothetical protein